MDELDPIQRADLALLRAEHQKRFQVMIAYLKEQIGEGTEYINPVVRVVVSDNGAYYELNDLPEDFTGVTGDHLERRFLDDSEAVNILTQCVQAISLITPENTRHFSLIALYTRRGIIDRRNCYVYAVQRNEQGTLSPPSDFGSFRPDVMPLFFKVKIDADFAPEALGFARGLIFCMANAGDRNLMIRVPFIADDLTNLSDLPYSRTLH